MLCCLLLWVVIICVLVCGAYIHLVIYKYHVMQLGGDASNHQYGAPVPPVRISSAQQSNNYQQGSKTLGKRPQGHSHNPQSSIQRPARPPPRPPTQPPPPPPPGGNPPPPAHRELPPPPPSTMQKVNTVWLYIAIPEYKLVSPVWPNIHENLVFFSLTASMVVNQTVMHQRHQPGGPRLDQED